MIPNLPLGKLFMILDDIYIGQCLVLDERINELSRIQKEWQQYGIYIKPFIVGKGTKLDKNLYNHVDTKIGPPKYRYSTTYPTWWKSPNPYNAWLSHRQIFKDFLKTKQDKLLLLEDDSFIEKDFNVVLNNVEQYLNILQWDMLYLGSYNHENTWVTTDHKNVMRVCGCAGFHGIILKRHVVEYLLTFDAIGPYDEITGKYLHGKFNAYAIYPSIVSQKSGYSFVENSQLEKPSRYNR